MAVYRRAPFNVGPSEAHAEDALRTKEQGYGGFTSCCKVAQECERRGIPTDLHGALWPHLQVFGATTDAIIPYMEGYGGAMDYELDWDFIHASTLE